MQNDSLVDRFPLITGYSRPMLKLYEAMDFVLLKNSPVLIEGESGTGKELVARSLHEQGPRAGRPYLTLFLPGVSESLTDTYLFGAAPGSCTGVPTGVTGHFELADGGTVPIDEIGKVSLKSQEKLLRFVDSGEAHKFGEKRPRYFDVRLLAMTNRSCPEMIRNGEMHEDLYYRIRESRIFVPPLRDRLDDIPFLLASWFPEVAGSDEAGAVVEMCQGFHWPGNVRELKGFLRSVFDDRCRVFCLSRAKEGLDRLREEAWVIAHEEESLSLEESTTRFRRSLVDRALESSGGDREIAAARLKISSRTLERILET